MWRIRKVVAAFLMRPRPPSKPETPEHAIACYWLPELVTANTKEILCESSIVRTRWP